MVETITPVVHGGRARWLGILALHVLGATTTAALFGSALGVIGRLLGAPWGRAGLIALVVAAAVYALGELRMLDLPVPQLRRQVPDWWRTFFGRPAAATLYGAGLGVGFLTYLADGTLVVVAFAALASGRPAIGALVVAPFGLARGLSSAMTWGSVTPERSRALVDRLASAPEGRRRAANAAALALMAGVSAVAASAAPSGAWPSVAAAVLAVAFGWAAVSKVSGGRRWRRALAVHELPPSVAPLVRRLVPAAEAIVPLLVVTGRPREAAAWAAVLVTAFSFELIRVHRRVGGRVPCGCFGGRDVVEVRTLLVRNAGLASLAVFVFLRGAEMPGGIGWPGAPELSDLLPLVLAVGSLVVAALTAWRASTWFASERPA